MQWLGCFASRLSGCPYCCLILSFSNLPTTTTILHHNLIIIKNFFRGYMILPRAFVCLYRHYHRLCLPPYHAVPQVVLKTSVLCTQHVPRASTLRRPAPLLPTLGARTVQPDYSKLCRQPMALRRTHAAPLRSVLRASTPRSPAMLQSRFAARNVHWDYSKLSPRSASIRLTPALTTPVVPRASTPR